MNYQVNIDTFKSSTDLLLLLSERSSECLCYSNYTYYKRISWIYENAEYVDWEETEI